MSDQIKPCPFCMGNNCTVTWSDITCWVECHGKSCSCEGPFGKTEQEAISAWNAAPRLTHAERAVLDAAVDYGADVLDAFESEEPTPAAWFNQHVERAEKMRIASMELARERRGGE